MGYIRRIETSAARTEKGIGDEYPDTRTVEGRFFASRCEAQRERAVAIGIERVGSVINLVGTANALIGVQGSVCCGIEDGERVDLPEIAREAGSITTGTIEWHPCRDDSGRRGWTRHSGLRRGAGLRVAVVRKGMGHRTGIVGRADLRVDGRAARQVGGVAVEGVAGYPNIHRRVLHVLAAVIPSYVSHAVTSPELPRCSAVPPAIAELSTVPGDSLLTPLQRVTFSVRLWGESHLTRQAFAHKPNETCALAAIGRF
jgi:hypothetical protein